MPSLLGRQQRNLDPVSEDDEMEQQEEDPDHLDFFDVIDIDWKTLVDLAAILIPVLCTFWLPLRCLKWKFTFACITCDSTQRHDHLSTSFVEIGYNSPNLSNQLGLVSKCSLCSDLQGEDDFPELNRRWFGPIRNFLLWSTCYSQASPFPFHFALDQWENIAALALTVKRGCLRAKLHFSNTWFLILLLLCYCNFA